LSDQSVQALDHALRLLGPRPRSERELGDRLRAAGHPDEAVEAALTRAKQLDLVDDAAFARQWVEERSSRKGFGIHKLRAELRAKGVASDVIDDALGSLDEDEQRASAEAFATKQAARLVDLPLPVQAARIRAALLRRGYEGDIANDAVRAALPPEGWD